MNSPAWGHRRFCHFVVTLAAVWGLVCLSGCGREVTTYHYDNQRTGWNSEERTLKPSNVNASSLYVLTLQLDDANDQVDTQPLIVRKVHVAGGKHDVVYVSTENNNVYAIDADTDTKLLKVNLGKAVPPLWGCGNNGPTIGINGTPAIDLISGTMYVIAYIQDPANGGNPEYYLHALDLSNLSDKVSPRLVAGSGMSNQQYPLQFQAMYQRQRPGLLLQNGNVYAGFGSFCDWGGSNSRGWVLGWQTGTLNPLAANDLNNTQTSEPSGMFLSSVWESGYGLAGDPGGNVYFTTGNSDPSGTTYDGCTNVQESVVKLPASLTRNCPAVPPPNPALFTPANESGLDQGDVDLGSAGVMALPDQAGSVPRLLVANGKDGSMFLLNRDNLGGFTASNAGALGGVQSIGIGNGFGCWCGPTYFEDATPHVVTSGGGWTLSWGNGTTLNSLQLWNVETAPSPKLVAVAKGSMPDTVQDPGFFTTVSSHGHKDAIIWAVSRPLTNSTNTAVQLYAFNATPSGNTLPLLFPGAVAGSWPNLGGNANIVPVVANGKVYVASYRELDIFHIHGHHGMRAVDRKEAIVPPFPPQPPEGPWEHLVSGTVSKIEGDRFTLETRDHKMVLVNSGKARARSRYAGIAVGNGVTAGGSFDRKGVLEAETVYRVKPHPATWPKDK